MLNINTVKKVAIITAIIITTIIIIFIIHLLLSKKNFIKRKSTSTELETLVIKGHNIEFEPTKDYYEIALSNNETSLSISAKAKSKSSKVKIYNNDDLTKHNEVYIYVTNKLGESKKYTIGYTNKNARKYFKSNIEDCNTIKDDYCIKFFNIKNSPTDNFILFSYDKLTNDGYPKTNLITVNDKLVFKKNIIDAEFKNFNILDDGNIFFTYNSTKEKNKIYLYGFNTTGNIYLNQIRANNNLKDLYTYNFEYKDNKIYLKTRVANLNQEYICKLNNDSIFEARYTMEYKTGSFNEPVMTSKLTTLEYKIIMNITC